MTNGGGGALILTTDVEEWELRVPAGQLCSSTRAELVALLAALDAVTEMPRRSDWPVIACAWTQRQPCCCDTAGRRHRCHWVPPCRLGSVS